MSTTGQDSDELTGMVAIAIWRRRQEASSEIVPPPDDNEEAENGSQFSGNSRVNISNGERVRTDRFPGQGDTAVNGSTDSSEHAFAEAQHEGLNAMIGLATCEVMGSTPLQTNGGQASQTELPVTGRSHDSISTPTPPGCVIVPSPPVIDRARPAPPVCTTADPSVPRSQQNREQAVSWSDRFAHLPALSLMVFILTVQAVLSLRFLHTNTAFGDEGLYLWAGHLEWAHWLHDTRIPAFSTWFSGSPVIYPPIGALADSIGGLAGARILSLCFMLAATCLLWGTASRLYGKQPAFFAAALFAVIGPTLHLGVFATYDAMSLFLLALASWCACGARARKDATGWILAAAVTLALANATKYASAIFDPIVVAVAVLSAYPRPGGKAALRRGALLLTCLTGTLAILLRLGGSWYIVGISQTTTMRPNGGAPVSRVLLESWQWTAVVVIAAVVGVLLNAVKSQSRWDLSLIGALAAAALLVPVEQARIQTTVSLDKHVDFGAWFASIAAGYALSCLASWLQPRYAKILVTTCLGAAIIPVAAIGIVQAQAMQDWPGAANLIAFLKPTTSHGGRFLAETDDVPEYYLPQTSWQQWSNTFSITLPNGHVENVNGSSAPYARAISHHYFTLVILSFSETAVMDQAITRCLRATAGYRIIGIVPYGGPVPGDYTVWAYRPSIRRDTA